MKTFKHSFTKNHYRTRLITQTVPTSLPQSTQKNFSTTIKIAKSLLLAITIAIAPVVAQAANLAIGDKAPNFSVKTLNGKEITLSDFVNDKPVYLKFWATWCSYCKVEMPHLQAIYDENGEQIEVLTS